MSDADTRELGTTQKGISEHVLRCDDGVDLSVLDENAIADLQKAQEVVVLLESTMNEVFNQRKALEEALKIMDTQLFIVNELNSQIERDRVKRVGEEINYHYAAKFRSNGTNGACISSGSMAA